MIFTAIQNKFLEFLHSYAYDKTYADIAVIEVKIEQV